MKKIMLLTLLQASMFVAFSQNIDNFEVGPYEVDYKGPGDYRFRLREGIDLYDYFGLAKDTMVQGLLRAPIAEAFQMEVFVSFPAFAIRGNSNVFGLSAMYKKQLIPFVFFNAGVLTSFADGKFIYNRYDMPYKRNDLLLELGIPLSIEFSNPDRSYPSLYGEVGFSSTYYSVVKAVESSVNGVVMDLSKESGLYLAPKLATGVYVPFYGCLIRLGVYGEYKIHCIGDVNIYKNRIGRAFLGANIGFIF